MTRGFLLYRCDEQLDEVITAQSTGKMKKLLTNMCLSVLHKLSKTIYNALKPENDPTNHILSGKVFVPADLYESLLMKVFTKTAARSFRLNTARVHRYCTRATLEHVIDTKALCATWGDKTTTVSVSADYPFNIKYMRESEMMWCVFVAVCRRTDGTLVISNSQVLRQAT